MTQAEFYICEDKVKLVQDTDYPWNGNVTMKVSAQGDNKFNIGLRIPGWCRNAEIKINGNPVDIYNNITNGYVLLNRHWANDDVIELNFEMPVELIEN